MYKGCALTRDAPALIVMPDIVGIQTVRDSISLDADTGKQRRLSANRDLLVAFGHCMKDHNLSPYIKKQDNPHGLPCKSKGRASEDALPVVHNNPPSHDPAAWPSVPLPRPGGEGFRCMAQKTAPASCYGNRGRCGFMGNASGAAKPQCSRELTHARAAVLAWSLLYIFRVVLYTFWLMALLALVAAACLASSVSAAATAAFISA